MKKSFEYVVSGTAFFKIVYKEAQEDPENLEMFEHFYGSLQNKKDHVVSFLYNAYTEKHIGKKLKDPFKRVGGIHNVYADSGGLQVITLGKQLTDAVKADVFRNQAASADIGLTFDEIPVVMIGERSARLELDTRRYEASLLEPSARQTGKNLRRQIEIFNELGSSCKPMLIIQGNNYDDYMRWTEVIQEELPPDYVSQIGGIAMGAAALGHGTLEDIKRAFYYTQLPIDLPTKHLHLLAVGSIYRMLPNIVFQLNGLYDGVHLSYDSTTHSSGVAQGRYFMTNSRGIGKGFVFDRNFDNRYYQIHADLQKRFPKFNVSIEDFYRCLNVSPRKLEEQGHSVNPSIQTYEAFVAGSVGNFIDEVYRVSRSMEQVVDLAEKVDKAAFQSLYSVKTTDDFRVWEKDVGKYLYTVPVKGPAGSLDGLFA